MTDLQIWVLNQIVKDGPIGATRLIARAAGKWYEDGHPTHWRRVDRAIQTLRKGGFIEYNGAKWTAR